MWSVASASADQREGANSAANQHAGASSVANLRSGESSTANQRSGVSATTNKTPALVPRKYSSPNPVPIVVPRDTKPAEGLRNKPADPSWDLLSLQSLLGLPLAELRSFARFMINCFSSLFILLAHHAIDS